MEKQCSYCKSTRIENGYCTNCKAKVGGLTTKKACWGLFFFLIAASAIQNDWFKLFEQ